MIFDTYCRSESALIACMAEMVVNGVSTRKLSRIVETLCGTTVSKSSISELCQDLDKEVESLPKSATHGKLSIPDNRRHLL